MLDCGKLCTAKMDIFPQITYHLNYEWSDSEEEEGKGRGQDISAQTRCVDITSADRDKLEKSKNEANTVKQTVGLEVREIMAVSVHR